MKDILEIAMMSKFNIWVPMDGMLAIIGNGITSMD